MEWQSIILSAIPTISSAVVGIIISRQVKSQKEIIENYKEYIQTTDWKKVKDHYENYTIPELEHLHIRDKKDTLTGIYIEKKI